MKPPSTPQSAAKGRSNSTRMKLEWRPARKTIAEQGGERFGVVTRVAKQLGITPESLRNWVNQAEVDKGQRPGTTTEDKHRIAELEKEVRELRRANEILKAASTFFAAALDSRLPRW